MGSPEESVQQPGGASHEAEARAAISAGAAECSRAVFLSYASQDAEAARGICDALRAAGIEVWFDQSELRGGDAWDHSIRKQIKTCALFIPVISRHTHDRDEGYFRLEWKLAVDRSHLMTAHRAFLLPVVIDDSPDDDENVPDRFREVQWTRMPGGNTPSAFVQRVQRLLVPPPSTTSRSAATAAPSAPAMAELVRASWQSKVALVGVVAVLAAASIYLLVARPWVSKHPAAPQVMASASAPAAAVNAASFTPPPHSIAVLPFVNISGDKEQEYFSDGLTEELLNSLSRVNELQVAARTSSFSFQGEHPDIATVAHRLNVASVLEGSVRRSGHTIRVTAQLNNAVTGFHLWSQTYDRDLGDVLKLQTDIATAVATALKVTLLGDLAAKIELGGTRNPAAFDAYLRGSKAYGTLHRAIDLQSAAAVYQSAAAAYTEAIRLDPNYALAFTGRSMALDTYAYYQAAREGRRSFDEALADARKAVALAPELGEAHLALARVFEDGFLDFADAGNEYSRAVSLAPGNARVLQHYGAFAVYMGHTEAGLAAGRHAVVLDPLSTDSHDRLGEAQWAARHYNESAAAFEEVITLDPNAWRAYAWRGFAYYGLGEFEHARSSCEVEVGVRKTWILFCLALVYEKLGRHVDAEAIFSKARAELGDIGPYQFAEIYAQWGNTPRALEWLQTAVRLRDSALGWLKTDPLMDPLRNEPRFQAIERELKFPD
jgi:TolB-like protein